MVAAVAAAVAAAAVAAATAVAVRVHGRPAPTPMPAPTAALVPLVPLMGEHVRDGAAGEDGAGGAGACKAHNTCKDGLLSWHLTGNTQPLKKSAQSVYRGGGQWGRSGSEERLDGAGNTGRNWRRGAWTTGTALLPGVSETQKNIGWERVSRSVWDASSN